MKHRIEATYRGEIFQFDIYDHQRWLTLLYNIAGITLSKNHVFIKYHLDVVPYLTPALVGHEAIHVYQAKKLGWKYLFVYLWEFIKGGFKYHNNSMEIEAYHYQNEVTWKVV